MTDYAATIAPPRLDRRDQARRDRLVRAEIEREQVAASVRARIAERESDARMKREAAAERRAAKAIARDERAARLARLAEWAGAHVIDLLFVPVIGVPALLSWTAMAAFGARLYPVVGYLLPAFSEGAMWAFAAAVTLTLRRYPGRPVWHLRTGIGVFAVFGAGLNFLHGLATPIALFPGLPAGYLTGSVMALISVAGVIAHQLITAGPRGKHLDEAELVEADDVPDIEADTTPDVTPDAGADTAPDVTPDMPDTEAATNPDTVTDTNPDTNPDTKRTPTRTRRGPSTADQVTALRKKHPDWTAVEIAGRLGVSDRTVRRHLSPKTSTDAPQANAA